MPARPGFLNQVPVNLLGKSLAGLALWPLVVIYLIKYSPAYPDSAAGYTAPGIGYFHHTPATGKTRQLCSITCYASPIKSTSSSPNQPAQMSSSNKPASSLLKVVTILWPGLDYGMKARRRSRPIAKAGSKVDYLDQIISQNGKPSPELDSSVAVLRSGKAVIDRKTLKESWQIFGQSGGNRLCVLA